MKKTPVNQSKAETALRRLAAGGRGRIGSSRRLGFETARHGRTIWRAVEAVATTLPCHSPLCYGRAARVLPIAPRP